MVGGTIGLLLVLQLVWVLQHMSITKKLSLKGQ